MGDCCITTLPLDWSRVISCSSDFFVVSEAERASAFVTTQLLSVARRRHRFCRYIKNAIACESNSLKSQFPIKIKLL